MTTLAVYLSELTPLIQQLEAALKAGEETLIAPARYFEWRIRARILQDKLFQAQKGPRAADFEEEIVDALPAVPVLPSITVGQAKAALPFVGTLREALNARRVKVALDAARAVERLVCAAD